ncbi:MAG: helix-turn-helix transcriptional regulator [Chromatiaceae bacterium]|nr:helix-turn-helix transcriptional regulator [Chromatiaceae bacterium]MCP5447705.1 helix-turn-helix transcriptional regulator [Chromatiaceae bacterium]
MKSATPSVSASSATTRSFEKVFGEAGTATSRTRAPVYLFEAYTAPQPLTPAKHTSIGQLAAEWEQDTKGRNALEEGRQWVADAFYGDDGDTVRALRLRKGWSQTRLAEELVTSQSHVARIERGTENLTIETCRKLSSALGIDLNTLDQALKRQEAIAQAKQR